MEMRTWISLRPPARLGAGALVLSLLCSPGYALAGTCVGGLNDTLACATNTDCPLGICKEPLTRDQIHCAMGFIKSSQGVVKTVISEALTCHSSLSQGGGGGGNDISDCILTDPALMAKLQKSAAKVDAKIDKYCSLPYPMTCPAPCDTADDGGATLDVDDDAELKACLLCYNV